MAEPADWPDVPGDNGGVESAQRHKDVAGSVPDMNAKPFFDRVQMATTGDLEQTNADLQTKVGLLQIELEDARKSLQYMNQLLAALKAHKKATAAAKAALEQLQQQVEERNDEITDLKADKARLQETNRNMQSELEEAEMSAMHAIAAAEEARKAHVTATQQLVKSHKLEAENMAHQQAQVIEQWRCLLHDANARETQRLVTILVMGAIDKAKSEEASQIQANIAMMKAEADLQLQDCTKKDREIERLELRITEQDSKVNELQGLLSDDSSEIQQLQGIIQEYVHEKAKVQADLAAAQDLYTELEKTQDELIDSHKAELEAVEQEAALLHSRIADLESVNDDLNITITSKAEDAEGKELVLAELRAELHGMSGLISAVETELQTYQLEHRWEHLETVLGDLKARPGSVIDLKGAVVSCSLQHVAGLDKLELLSPGSVLRNGTLRLPYGCTLCVKPSAGTQLVDITLQMMEVARKADGDTRRAVAEAVPGSALLQLEPGAELTVLRCRVSGCCGVGVSVHEGAKLLGESLWMEHCTQRAIEVYGGHMDLVGCSLKDSGGGLICSGHAHVKIQHLSAHGVEGQLVRATDGAELHLQHALLEGGDVALIAQGQAQLDCQGVTLLGGPGSAGVRLEGSGTTARLQACTLQKHGRAALYVADGGDISMASCTVSDYGRSLIEADGAALQVCGAGSKALVHGCEFQWNRFDSISCASGGFVEVVGSKLTRNDGCCILSSGVGSKAMITDTTISGASGTAMKARHSAVIEASGLRVVHCATGIEGKSCATVLCTKSRFEGCSLRACGSFGGAKVSLTDVEIFASACRALHTLGAGSSLRCVDCKLSQSSGTQALCELGASMMLEGVQIADGTGDGIVVTGPETSATIRACSVGRQKGAGVRVKSANLEFCSSSITACGLAGAVEEAASLHMTDARIADCRGGISGNHQAHIIAKSSNFVAISGTAALSLSSNGTHAHMEACDIARCTHGGVLAGPGSSCKVMECAFEHNGASCIQSRGAKSTVDLHQCMFKGNSAPCVGVVDGGAASATDCQIRTNAGDAMCIDGPNSTGTILRCQFRETEDHTMVVQAGASCNMDSCEMDGSRTGAGLVALGEGSQITCTGGYVSEMQQAACVAKDAATVSCKAVQLKGTLCGSGCIATAGGVFIAVDCALEGNSDHGIIVAEGGQVQLQACRLANNRMGCGVFIADDGSQVTAYDCKLQDNGNCGALVTGGGVLKMQRCEIVEHMQGAGAVVHGQGSLVDVREGTIVGSGAVGLVAFDGGRADCKRTSVSFATSHGVEARGGETEINLENCCIEKNTGYGVLVRKHATVHLRQGCVVAGNGQASQTNAEGDDAHGKLIVHPKARVLRGGAGVCGR